MKDEIIYRWQYVFLLTSIFFRLRQNNKAKALKTL